MEQFQSQMVAMAAKQKAEEDSDMIKLRTELDEAQARERALVKQYNEVVVDHRAAQVFHPLQHNEAPA